MKGLVLISPTLTTGSPWATETLIQLTGCTQLQAELLLCASSLLAALQRWRHKFQAVVSNSSQWTEVAALYVPTVALCSHGLKELSCATRLQSWEEIAMKQKQCICKELKEEVRSAVFGESCENGAAGSPHNGSRWDNHPSLYSSASWLADTSSLTLQITSVSTIQLR